MGEQIQGMPKPASALEVAKAAIAKMDAWRAALDASKAGATLGSQEADREAAAACIAYVRTQGQRTLTDSATFEDFREQLAVGALTPSDQMAFDNMLHEKLRTLSREQAVTEEMVEAASRAECIAHGHDPDKYFDVREMGQFVKYPNWKDYAPIMRMCLEAAFGAKAEGGEDVSSARKLGAHTVYGSDSAMDELDAIIRQAKRYTASRLSSSAAAAVPGGCVVAKLRELLAAWEMAEATKCDPDDPNRANHEGYERALRDVIEDVNALLAGVLPSPENSHDCPHASACRNCGCGFCAAIKAGGPERKRYTFREGKICYTPENEAAAPAAGGGEKPPLVGSAAKRVAIQRAAHAAPSPAEAGPWEPVRPEDYEPPEEGCSQHPCAPHGFLRNASHSEDRYVCECEYWRPDRSCAAHRLAPASLAGLSETELFKAAYGLCCGYSWDGGNHAIKHGYRLRLLEAVNEIRSVADFENKRAALRRLTAGVPSASVGGGVVNLSHQKVTRVKPWVDVDTIALEAATDICAMGLCHTRAQLIAQMQVRIVAALTAALAKEAPRG